MKTKYMYMRFLNDMLDTVCPLLFVFIQLVTEGKGSSEYLPLLWILYADLGRTDIFYTLVSLDLSAWECQLGGDSPHSPQQVTFPPLSSLHSS